VREGPQTSKGERRRRNRSTASKGDVSTISTRAPLLQPFLLSLTDLRLHVESEIELSELVRIAREVHECVHEYDID
jgi:hypothetical protein